MNSNERNDGLCEKEENGRVKSFVASTFKSSFTSSRLAWMAQSLVVCRIRVASSTNLTGAYVSVRKISSSPRQVKPQVAEIYSVPRIGRQPRDLTFLHKE